jgi:membrane protein DedA with SNARE-associated domain
MIDLMKFVFIATLIALTLGVLLGGVIKYGYRRWLGCDRYESLLGEEAARKKRGG